MMIDDHKTDHNMIISSYSDYGILNEDLSLPISACITLFFIYQKLNDNLMSRWHAPFYLLYALFIFKFIKAFVQIIKSGDEEDSTQIHEVSQDEAKFHGYEIKFKLNIHNLDKIVLISNLFSMLHIVSFFFTIYFLAEYLDKKADEYMFYSIYALQCSCLIHVGYTLLIKIFRHEIKKCYCGPGECQHGSSISFITSLFAPALSYITTLLTICSGGACTQIYLSSISSLLGTFGVTATSMAEWALPLTIVLLAIALYSIYVYKRKLSHPPFILAVVGCIFILGSHVIDESYSSYILWPGNVMMIGAGLWNAKINRMYGLPRARKD
jgi:hypothetical protein